MRHQVILLFLFVFAALGLQAQKLTVESFDVAPGDLDARSSTTRRVDRNGTPCALVKVQLPLQGAVFDGVVGDVQFRAGTYWVYLPDGGYLMSISHPQYHKLDLNLRSLRPAEERFYGVEQLTTYNLVIDVPQSSEAVQLDDGLQRLVMHVTPMNSRIVIDGKKEYVPKDGQLHIILSKGRHRYHVEAEGYANKEGTMTLGDREGIVDVTLQPVRQATNETHEQTSQQAANESMTITVGKVEFKMIRVEGGTFQMGATSEQESEAFSYEKPVHSVTLSTYYIGETEVTQALWQAVMDSNPSHFKGDKRPVEQVSWDDCQDFIGKLNKLTGRTFRLPTEAEWEYAARGGNKSQHYIYSGSNDVDDVAWYKSKKPQPVKGKRPNELGLYDMSGNVYEWCSDWSGSYDSSAQTNPTGPATGEDRVSRGGGYIDFPRHCRVSYRDRMARFHHSDRLGLRLVMVAPL